MWQTAVCVGVVVLFLLYRAITGVARSIRTNNERLNKALAALKPEDMPRLAKECQEFFHSSLAVNLDFGPWKESMKAMDAALKNREQLQKIFRGLSHPEVAYYWVLPLGAYLGEIMKRYAKGTWKFNGEGAPTMEFPVGDGTATAFPFDKVQKHCWQGEPGDLVAYVHMQTQLDKMLAALEQQKPQNPSEPIA